MTGKPPLPPHARAKLRRLEHLRNDEIATSAQRYRRYLEARADLHAAMGDLNRIAGSYNDAKHLVGISYSAWVGNGPKIPGGKSERPTRAALHPVVERAKERVEDAAQVVKEAEAAMQAHSSRYGNLYVECRRYAARAGFDVSTFTAP